MIRMNWKDLNQKTAIICIVEPIKLNKFASLERNMNSEYYYCPLCGNKPYKSFVACRLLSKPICNDCDDTIRDYFMRCDEGSECPAIIQNLREYSGLPIEEVKEIWKKEQIITSLLELRDAVNYCDESGNIWEEWALKDLLSQTIAVIELGRQYNI